MNVMKGLLYFVGALFIVSVVLVFIPWASINALMGFFGAPAFPDAPIVQYTVKILYLIMFWIGVLLLVAVRSPVQHAAVLAVLGGMCLSLAVACLAVGWAYDVPPFFYWDAASSGVIGALILLYRHQASRADQG